MQVAKQAVVNEAVVKSDICHFKETLCGQLKLYLRKYRWLKCMLIITGMFKLYYEAIQQLKVSCGSESH